MTFTDKHIVDSYAELFEGLNPTTKAELIERLSKSLKNKKKTKDNFSKSFGAFASDKRAEDIIADIRKSRKFRKKEIKF